MKANLLDLKAAQDALGVELIPNGKGSQALFDTVIALQANRRAGTHKAKTKAEVAGSGRKPWRQKGTGNARAGYRRSPVWTGGGVAHGPVPRDYSKITPKKVKKLALKKALSEVAKAGRLASVPEIQLDAPKTRTFVSWLKQTGLPEGTTLIVTAEKNETLLLASRNVPYVLVVRAADVNAEELIQPKNILITQDAWGVLSNRLK